jgi:hypothetical protein
MNSGNVNRHNDGDIFRTELIWLIIKQRGS